jgi:prefoldin subunit 5
MTDFELGRHEAQIQALTDRTERIETKLDTVILTLSERKGERRTIAYVATAAGGFGSLLVTVLAKLFIK